MHNGRASERLDQCRNIIRSAAHLNGYVRQYDGWALFLVVRTLLVNPDFWWLCNRFHSDPSRRRLPLQKLLCDLLILKGGKKSPWVFRYCLEESGDVAISAQLSLDVGVFGRVLGLPAEAEVDGMRDKGLVEQSADGEGERIQHRPGAVASYKREHGKAVHDRICSVASDRMSMFDYFTWHWRDCRVSTEESVRGAIPYVH